MRGPYRMHNGHVALAFHSQPCIAGLRAAAFAKKLLIKLFEVLAVVHVGERLVVAYVFPSLVFVISVPYNKVRPHISSLRTRHELGKHRKGRVLRPTYQLLRLTRHRLSTLPSAFWKKDPSQ